MNVTVAYDGTGKAGGLKVYYDGEPQPTDTEADALKSMTRTTVPLKVGQRNTTSRVNGVAIADLRVYDRPVTAIDAKQLAGSQRTFELLSKPADKRTPKEAEEGRLSTLLGGDDAAKAHVRPVVEAYADTIIDAGPLGAALTVKIVNNFVSFTNAVVISETFAAASAMGVPFAPLCAMIEAGGSNSVMFQWIKPWILEGDDGRGRGRLGNGRRRQSC